jgi:hypothetical protein
MVIITVEAKEIKSKIEHSWQDATMLWKDDYTKKFRVGVVDEMQNNLDEIDKVSKQLSSAVDSALVKIADFLV